MPYHGQVINTTLSQQVQFHTKLKLLSILSGSLILVIYIVHMIKYLNSSGAYPILPQTIALAFFTGIHFLVFYFGYVKKKVQIAFLLPLSFWIVATAATALQVMPPEHQHLVFNIYAYAMIIAAFALPVVASLSAGLTILVTTPILYSVSGAGDIENALLSSTVLLFASFMCVHVVAGRILIGRDLKKVIDFSLHSPSPMMRMNKNGQFEMVNIAATKLLESDSKLAGLLSHLVRKNGVTTFRLEIAGQHYQFQASWVKESQIYNIYAYDITESTKVSEELDIKRSQMSEMANLAALGELSASIAHEINNPLVVILGHTRVLQKSIKEPSEIQRNSFQLIFDTCHRIAQVIKSMKSMSHGHLSEEVSSQPVAEIVDLSLELCSDIIRKNGIQVKLNIPAEIQAECRSTQISQVLVNLIRNACQAMEATDSPKIQIDCTTTWSELIISVKDNGPGVPEHIRQQIFEPFFTSKPAGVGTGLGLAISAKIMEKNHGDISFKSHSEGATFQIRLPQSANFKKAS